MAQAPSPLCLPARHPLVALPCTWHFQLGSPFMAFHSETGCVAGAARGPRAILTAHRSKAASCTSTAFHLQSSGCLLLPRPAHLAETFVDAGAGYLHSRGAWETPRGALRFGSARPASCGLLVPWAGHPRFQSPRPLSWGPATTCPFPAGTAPGAMVHVNNEPAYGKRRRQDTVQVLQRVGGRRRQRRKEQIASGQECLLPEGNLARE